MQFAQVYCENGPLHGQILIQHEMLKQQLRGGFYMRNEFHASPKKCLWLTWVGAEDTSVVAQIGGNSHDITIDTARIDRDGMTWLRLRKQVIEPELYLRWKLGADERTPVSVVFLGEKYEGCTDLVGMNEAEGFMFLQFKGKKVNLVAGNATD